MLQNYVHKKSRMEQRQFNGRHLISMCIGTPCKKGIFWPGYIGRYGRSTASSQYFLQLAAYLGIPVIAWNPDNSGLEKVGY